MENLYDDELMPDNFEQIAKAYSKSLKEKGFIFVNLEEEEFQLLLSEIFVIFEKMKACLKNLEKSFESKFLIEKINLAQKQLSTRFGKNKSFSYCCVEDEVHAFLSLVSLYGTLVIKLMMLSVKSGELELCNQIIASISGVFAESFSTEGFIVN